MPPSSRHSAHSSHHPHAGSRDLHHSAGGPPPPQQGGPGMGPGPGNGPMHHPHSPYAQTMPPPPGLPPHAMNGVNGPPSAHGGPPPRMVMADGPGGAGGPPPPPPHIPRSSSAQSRIMEAGGAPAGPPASSSPAVQKLSLANEAAWVSPIAGVHRTLDNFEKALDYFQRVLNIVPENGGTWGSMGHCYLMTDDQNSNDDGQDDVHLALGHKYAAWFLGRKPAK
ncbi:hypothetical protein EX895_005451 [Sporisorium graminicola]|uniref:Uncharacterized protein n=1 Tax=Sporisorium graminicola TaxID=280036 RepID=A0A4U7KNI5_9BASI|nr:hypothetical protein EX895_005451 [Sporisorium graminicola]TKY85910.1 hypothetical protein EX895_005451 [Sporisorium graminicola]